MDLQGKLTKAKEGNVMIGIFVDHRKYSNPHESRSGVPWEAEKKTSWNNKKVCVHLRIDNTHN